MTAQQWRRVLVEAARLQRACVPRRDELLAAGLPDCSPSTVLERFDRLVDSLSSLPPDHPSRLDAELAADVRAERPRVADAAALLASGPHFVTLQHGDLHPWNVFDEGGELRLFDFADAQWAHAFEMLAVPHAWVTDGFGLDWTPLLAAYLEVWEIEVSDARPLLEAAFVCHPVNRALTWLTALQRATPDELVEWGDGPPYHLHGVTRRV